MFDDPSPRMTSFKVEIQTHVSLIRQTATSVEQKYKEILADTNNYAFRSKRGLVNGIGSIFKSITGNLDYADGEYFNECINKVTRDEREIEQLLKNQISVTSSVLRNFNSTIQQFQIDEKNFNENIVTIQNALNRISDDVAFYEAQVKVLNFCQSLMESYVFLENYLDDILNAITFARLRILHSSIITPIDLITSLQEISRTLTRNNFPLPTYTSSVAKYLDIIELEAYQSENQVVFVLLIPLVEPETYTLYKTFPIPILDNRTGFFHILPTTQRYIARDDDSLLYVSLQNLESCKNLQTRLKICSNILQYPIDSDAICEAQLLRQQKILPRTCQTSILAATDYNVQEIDYNLWLVTISEPLPVTVRCGNRNPESQILKTNSIIKLQPNCNAFIGSTRIHSKYLVQNFKNITYQSHPVKIPYECCNHLPERYNVPDLKPLKLSKINYDDLSVAQHRLNQYSEELDKIIQEPFVTKHYHWFTTASIVIIVLILVVLILCKCRKKKYPKLCLTGNSGPPPSPRSERSELKQTQWKKLLPRRRTSIHPEPSFDESLELQANP